METAPLMCRARYSSRVRTSTRTTGDPRARSHATWVTLTKAIAPGWLWTSPAPRTIATRSGAISRARMGFTSVSGSVARAVAPVEGHLARLGEAAAYRGHQADRGRPDRDPDLRGAGRQRHVRAVVESLAAQHRLEPHLLRRLPLDVDGGADRQVRHGLAGAHVGDEDHQVVASRLPRAGAGRGPAAGRAVVVDADPVVGDDLLAGHRRRVLAPVAGRETL